MESQTPHRVNRIPLILSLLALIVTFFVVRWFVINNRHEGSMTPIEAQGMDMTAMTPPPGVFPVGVETVGQGSARTTVRVPGTVAALSDEDVVARIAGRVTKVLVYPGDRVKAGQLLATLDADELALQAAASRLQGQAGASRVRVAESQVEQLKSERDAAAAEAGAHAAHEKEARANRTALAAEAARAREDWNSRAALIDDRKAALTYAENNLAREKSLFEAGAISRDEYEQAIAARDAAASQLRAAQADSESAKRAADAAQARVQAADNAISVAIGEHTASRMRVQAIDKAIAKARAEVATARADAAAISAGASSADVIAGYRNLRALANGVVAERVVSPGSLVQAGQPVLKIKVINQVRVQARVPGRYVGEIRDGSPVVITVGEKTRTGKISSVFPVQDSMTRTFTVEAIVENSDALLQPGAFVTMEVQASSARQGLSVRNEALRKDAAGNAFVWVLKQRESQGATDWTCTMHPEISEDGPGICPICKMDLTPRETTAKYIAVRRSVVTGAKNAAVTIITSGLSSGDQVIYGGTDDLTEGAPVQPVAWGENGPAELPSAAGK